MWITTLADNMAQHAPRDDVAYLADVARVLLGFLALIAAVVFITHGGRFTSLAPTG